MQANAPQDTADIDNNKPLDERRATDNKGFVKLGVQWLIEHLCIASSFVVG